MKHKKDTVNIDYHPIINDIPHDKTVRELIDFGVIDEEDIKNNKTFDWCKSFYDFPKDKKKNVTLLCHSGKVDISTLHCKDYDDIDKNIMLHCSEIQSGIMSLKNFKYIVRDHHQYQNNKRYVVPTTLSIRDTMGLAPPGMKRLQDLGDTVGVNKLEIDEKDKNRMDLLLRDNPRLFFEYASRDSVVTLLYASSIFGYNKRVPITLTSATATAMRDSMIKYLQIDDKIFDEKYRGLKKVSKGKVKRDNGIGFLSATSLEPLTPDVEAIHQFTSHAYHGGFNSATKIGWYEEETHDYDLQSAYPTAMVHVPDINWDKPVIREVVREDLTLDDFATHSGYMPTIPFVAFVSFEFPTDIKYPSIPLNVDGNLVFPRTSDGLQGVYAMGIEIYLALKLGAKVHCHRGYFLNTLKNEDGTTSYSLASAVQQLVTDRIQAKAEHSKGSLEDLILKVMVNSGYGKNAQNVVDKTTWNVYTQKMEEMGCSSITNPFSAAFTTSYVRAELIAAMNQLNTLGYDCYSVTTDGFISNAPEDVLKGLDLFGITRFSKMSRSFLTNGQDDEIWEEKHRQNKLLNLTTRGNCAPNTEGVRAFNSTKSPFERKSLDDRKWFIHECLTRNHGVEYDDTTWTPFKKIARGATFTVKAQKRRVNMDFDMKRKPIRDSFVEMTVDIYDNEYNIANFDTVPYDNVKEFKLYRQKKALCKVLRTIKDWEQFYIKIDYNSSGARVKDIDFARVQSVIMGHRFGLWVVDELDSDMTVQQKCNWVNSLNLCDREYKTSDWKNARRKERYANMLPVDELTDVLNKMNAHSYQN